MFSPLKSDKVINPCFFLVLVAWLYLSQALTIHILSISSIPMHSSLGQVFWLPLPSLHPCLRGLSAVPLRGLSTVPQWHHTLATITPLLFCFISSFFFSSSSLKAGFYFASLNPWCLASYLVCSRCSVKAFECADTWIVVIYLLKSAKSLQPLL